MVHGHLLIWWFMNHNLVCSRRLGGVVQRVKIAPSKKKIKKKKSVKNDVLLRRSCVGDHVAPACRCTSFPFLKVVAYFFRNRYRSKHARDSNTQSPLNKSSSSKWSNPLLYGPLNKITTNQSQPSDLHNHKLCNKRKKRASTLKSSEEDNQKFPK